MTALPRALGPWAKQLAIFPEEIAGALGELASRLASLVGAMATQVAGEGTFDGFDGLTRRGSYERLLLTEWFLQEELPEEFIRRAISGEHAFLQRAYRQPSEALRSCVLFDAGPDQLGAPRVAHLAALIVLAQRAEQRKAQWTWGILQDASRRLHTAVNPATVLELLRARCTRRVSSRDVDRWRETVDASSELWFVGSERLAHEAQTRNAFLLALSEILEPGAPARLQAAVHASRRPRAVVLTLPPAPICTRLLRDPFEAAVVSPCRSDGLAIHPKTNFVFSVDGGLLHARGAGRSLVTHQIPQSPRAGVGRPASFVPPRDGVIVAVGQASKRRTVVVVWDPDAPAGLTVHHLSKRRVRSQSGEFHVAIGERMPPRADPAQPLRPLGVLARDVFCFVDAEGNLAELRGGKLTSRLARADPSSKAMSGGLAYVGRLEGAPGLVRQRTLTGKVEGTEPLASDTTYFDLSTVGGEPGPFFFGDGAASDLVSCVRVAGNRWAILQKGRASFVQVPTIYTIVGIVQRGHEPRPFLIGLHESRTKFALISENVCESVITTSSRIVYATASDAAPHIAYLTQDGQLGVYSCRHAAMLLRVVSEVAS